MFSKFKTEPVPEFEGCVLVQPPAGLLPLIQDRLVRMKDEKDNILSHEWYAVYILASLHIKCDDDTQKPVACEEAGLLGHKGYNTLRSVYQDMTDEEFKTLVKEFVFKTSRDDIEKVFELLDSLSYITKKSVNALKNDSPPEVTTGS